MASFALGEQFHVVICVFDTLNHLPVFDDWRSLFARVHEHLAEGGLFVFDVNTVTGCAITATDRGSFMTSTATR